ncbi:hypothetical protein COU20_03745 [Candidatus Kaiserbacteria bacterium CG10_big_fil_rev_8_21_14_0_10_59_10]|uniref:Aminotransferase class I/classII large domain-containing protein n=1 Tax=Candidatus Kaiserbacteria bacterium CG10_big_fil_rev_8_21_14_0_10_59_10 TaxID=1974612 RepID=A0A2H0U761_9BACT|nr:MAG: hypothetical protein COU20_03745 [Candidatus Kaiserbacteria bacterium CG10_big_fil_rev_8_21_14_0_10_59_10]
MSPVDALLPLHRNESYWLLDEQLIAVCMAAMSPATLPLYPSYESLRKALSAYTGKPTSMISIAAGSDAIIEAIARVCVERNLRAILPLPTFYGYEKILSRVRLPIMPLAFTERDGAFIMPIDTILDSMTSGTALFLCQPNNPLGSRITESNMGRIFDRARENNVLVVLDEAYYEFDNPTYLAQIGSVPLIVVRTFSKGFGLSGARVGYAVAPEDITAALTEQLLPWPVAHPSTCAALALLDANTLLAKRRTLLIKERARFSEELAATGVTVYPSFGNFVLIRVESADTIAAKLARDGILVADGGSLCFNPVGSRLLLNTLRIAIPAPEHRTRVVGCIRSAINS